MENPTTRRLELLREKCRKIRRCRQELTETDLRGRYRTAFESLLAETAAAANDCLMAAMFGGMHCWDCDPAALENALTEMTTSEWYRQSCDAAGQAVRQGDDEGLIQFCREVRQKIRMICLRLTASEGYIEDEEAYITWAMTDPILEPMVRRLS